MKNPTIKITNRAGKDAAIKRNQLKRAVLGALKPEKKYEMKSRAVGYVRIMIVPSGKFELHIPTNMDADALLHWHMCYEDEIACAKAVLRHATEGWEATEAMVLADGRVLIIEETTIAGMAGEPMALIKFNVEGEDTELRKVKPLLLKGVAERLEKYVEDIAAGNDASAEAFVI